jgi:hypothetical protein
MDSLITMRAVAATTKSTTPAPSPNTWPCIPPGSPGDDPGNDGASVQAVYNELVHDRDSNARDRNGAIAAGITRCDPPRTMRLAATNRLEYLHQLIGTPRSHGVETPCYSQSARASTHPSSTRCS